VRYCAAKLTKWGWDVTGASNTDELNQLLRAKCMIRRLKKDVLKELPSKIRKRVYLDPADSRELEQAFAREREIFQSLIAEFGSLEAALKQRGLGGLEELTKARHAVALAKIPLACQYILEVLEEAEQLVVFVWHRDVAYTLRDCLEQSQISCVMATGDMSTEARHESVKAFQAGLARVFIGTIAAAGTGVTLTAASRVIFIEEAWQPGVVVQAEDRIHRIGQEADSVFAEHLIVQGSVDEMIVNQLDSKSSIIGSILDSDNAKMFSEE
jgi:SWI/SNF-related matrix-associated actin-dependent regulator 1 of chromatin subfamily A